jgi:hypothetical protein
VAAIRPWARRLQSEVEVLPDTLATLRVAAENIRTVSADLTEVAAALKGVTKALNAVGLAEATEGMTRAADLMRQSMAGVEAANKAVEDGLLKLPGADLLKPWLRNRQ